MGSPLMLEEERKLLILDAGRLLHYALTTAGVPEERCAPFPSG